MPDTPTIPYDLFISYAHRDNVRGQVRELRDAINDKFEGFPGRPLKIFFDVDDIPPTGYMKRRPKWTHRARTYPRGPEAERGLQATLAYILGL
jgi:hypothetical protein